MRSKLDQHNPKTHIQKHTCAVVCVSSRREDYDAIRIRLDCCQTKGTSIKQSHSIFKLKHTHDTISILKYTNLNPHALIMGINATSSVAAFMSYDKPLQLEGDIYNVQVVSDIPWDPIPRSCSTTAHSDSKLSTCQLPYTTDAPPAKPRSASSNESLMAMALITQGSMLKRRLSADDLHRHARCMTTAKSLGQAIGVYYTWASDEAPDKDATSAPDTIKRLRVDRWPCCLRNRPPQQQQLL